MTAISIATERATADRVRRAVASLAEVGVILTPEQKAILRTKIAARVPVEAETVDHSYLKGKLVTVYDRSAKPIAVGVVTRIDTGHDGKQWAVVQGSDGQEYHRRPTGVTLYEGEPNE